MGIGLPENIQNRFEIGKNVISHGVEKVEDTVRIAGELLTNEPIDEIARSFVKMTGEKMDRSLNVFFNDLVPFLETNVPTEEVNTAGGFLEHVGVGAAIGGLTTFAGTSLAQVDMDPRVMFTIMGAVGGGFLGGIVWLMRR